MQGKKKQVGVAQENLESSIAYLGLASLTATSPAEAYPIGKIIKEEDWDSLQDIYWLLLKEDGPASDFDAYPLFVRNRLNKLRDIKDETEKQMVCGILSFLTHLVMYKDFDLDELIISTPAKNHLFPSTIYRKCKGLFKDKIKSHNMNRLICNVLLLTLHVDKFKTNPQDIAKDLRMSSTLHLDKYFNNLGCKFVREDSVVLATLPVPLEFPEILTW